MTPESGPDWFVHEWLIALKKRPVDLVRGLEWDKTRVSKLLTGVQPYKRNDINAIAGCLGIEPFELLMHPDDALAMRDFRKSAAIVAAADQARVLPPVEKPARTPAANAPTPPRKRSA